MYKANNIPMSRALALQTNINDAKTEANSAQFSESELIYKKPKINERSYLPITEQNNIKLSEKPQELMEQQQEQPKEGTNWGLWAGSAAGVLLGTAVAGPIGGVIGGSVFGATSGALYSSMQKSHMFEPSDDGAYINDPTRKIPENKNDTKPSENSIVGDILRKTPDSFFAATLLNQQSSAASSFLNRMSPAIEETRNVVRRGYELNRAFNEYSARPPPQRHYDRNNFPSDLRFQTSEDYFANPVQLANNFK